MDHIQLLRYVTAQVDNGNPDTVSKLVSAMKDNGIVRNMHIGKHKEIKDFFDDNNHVAEWLLGQYMDIIEEGSWFAMNSLINKSYSFLEEVK